MSDSISRRWSGMCVGLVVAGDCGSGVVFNLVFGDLTIWFILAAFPEGMAVEFCFYPEHEHGCPHVSHCPHLKIKADGEERHEVKSQVVVCKRVCVAGFAVGSLGRTVLDVVF